MKRRHLDVYGSLYDDSIWFFLHVMWLPRQDPESELLPPDYEKLFFFFPGGPIHTVPSTWKLLLTLEVC